MGNRDGRATIDKTTNTNMITVFDKLFYSFGQRHPFVSFRFVLLF